MVTTNDDAPELPDGISTSSNKGKDWCFTDPFVCGLPSSKAQAMVTTNDDLPELPDGISTSSNKGKDCCFIDPFVCGLPSSRPQAMVTTNDDPPEEFPDGISTSSNKGKDCFSLQPCLEELVYEVFVRLPVKSLIRFRCVSKGMLRLIDSPYFIKNHNIHRSVISEGDREYAIFLYQPRFPLHRLFSLSFEKTYLMNRAKTIELNSTFAQEGWMQVMGGCCNGIFCFMNCQCFIFWNPSNGTFRKVDYSTSPSRSTDYASMGYDCVNDDYKIIRFIKTETSLEVYSFRKDSWRKITIKDIPPHHYCNTSAVCIGGVMHWLWNNYGTKKSVFIDAFDLATETFTSLPLPLEARQLQTRPCHLTDFEGRLCITFFTQDYLSWAKTIWVMEKYGVESSWTKLEGDCYRVSCNTRTFYFPNSRRRMLSNLRWLSWWDPQDGSYEDIEIPGLLEDQVPDYEAYVYVRNLVRLDQSLV